MSEIQAKTVKQPASETPGKGKNVSAARASILGLRKFVSGHIMGQETLINRLLIALLSDGHLLVEGAPGLAKTRAVKTLATGLEADFHRIQFTPDLLPADLTGTDVYRSQTSDFQFQPGPLFHNLLLADEINRAPAKVQSALLEAMGERQITVGDTTYPLPDLFLVMATQNPLEQEGTYPLPEAQLDRFLMHVLIDYPSEQEELAIVHLARREAMAMEGEKKQAAEPYTKLQSSVVHAARREILSLFMAEALEKYITQIVLATRNPEVYDAELGKQIQYGCSPRASINLDRCARAHAWLAGRDYVTPDDIQAVAPDIMRHRLVLSFTAEASGVTRDEIVARVLQLVAVP